MKKKKRNKKKANKGVIIVSFVIILQLFLLMTGFNPFSHNKKPSKKTVSQNVQRNMTSGSGSLRLTGVSKKSFGSYAREVPPLNTDLRPYYQIYTFIHVKPKGIYQQFAVVPIVDGIPKYIQKEMNATHLPIMTREFNTSASIPTPLNESHNGQVNMVTPLRYDKLYNPVNEQVHFFGKPYVIPPKTRNVKITASFTNDSIQSNGLSFNRINDSEAKFLIQRSSNNPSLSGY